MKKILLAALLTALLTGTVFAQSMGGWESPQSISTQGRIRSAADDFIRPDAYVNIRDWFAMASFGTAGMAHFGYGTKLDDLYIAGYYGGNFMNGLYPFNYTESNETTWPGGEKVVPDYGSAFLTGAPNSITNNNRVAILIGIADMGFRFSYHSAYQGFNESNVIVGGSNYANYERNLGTITPQFAWSLTKNLTSNGIRPFAVLDLGFISDYTKTEIAYTGTSPGATIQRSANYIQPSLTLGLGGYTLTTLEGGFRISTDLEYNLMFRMYDNDYSYTDGQGNNKIKSINGLNTGSLTENDWMQNTITPFLAGQWNNENFAFRIQFRLPLIFRNSSSTEMDVYNTSGDIRKDGADSSTSFFSINPQFRLGTQWRVMPQLALNMGGRVNFGTYEVTTVESETYTDGIKNTNSGTKNVTSEMAIVQNQLNLGLTFNPINYLTFEATTGVAIGNNMSFFGNMTTFGNFMVSFRF
ncbi:MAG: hypothetical protein FWD24_00785 [Treponema sp.]|nr:hypothetical protein [Treponema sp.]